MIWDWVKRKEQRWFGRQITEEHILSLALNDPELCVLPANGIIKRIWTADNYSNVDGCENKLDIWHLPAEKISGFPRLYRKLLDMPNDQDLDDDAFLRLAFREMNLSPSSQLQWIRLFRARVKYSVKALFAHKP